MENQAARVLSISDRTHSPRPRQPHPRHERLPCLTRPPRFERCSSPLRECLAKSLSACASQSLRAARPRTQPPPTPSPQVRTRPPRRRKSAAYTKPPSAHAPAAQARDREPSARMCALERRCLGRKAAKSRRNTQACAASCGVAIVAIRLRLGVLPSAARKANNTHESIEKGIGECSSCFLQPKVPADPAN